MVTIQVEHLHANIYPQDDGSYTVFVYDGHYLLEAFALPPHYVTQGEEEAQEAVRLWLGAEISIQHNQMAFDDVAGWDMLGEWE